MSINKNLDNMMSAICKYYKMDKSDIKNTNLNSIMSMYKIIEKKF